MGKESKDAKESAKRDIEEVEDEGLLSPRRASLPSDNDDSASLPPEKNEESPVTLSFFENLKHRWQEFWKKRRRSPSPEEETFIPVEEDKRRSSLASEAESVTPDILPEDERRLTLPPKPITPIAPPPPTEGFLKRTWNKIKKVFDASAWTKKDDFDKLEDATKLHNFLKPENLLKDKRFWMILSILVFLLTLAVPGLNFLSLALIAVKVPAFIATAISSLVFSVGGAFFLINPLFHFRIPHLIFAGIPWLLIGIASLFIKGLKGIASLFGIKTPRLERAEKWCSFSLRFLKGIILDASIDEEKDSIKKRDLFTLFHDVEPFKTAIETDMNTFDAFSRRYRIEDASESGLYSLAIQKAGEIPKVVAQLRNWELPIGSVHDKSQTTAWAYHNRAVEDSRKYLLQKFKFFLNLAKEKDLHAYDPARDAAKEERIKNQKFPMTATDKRFLDRFHARLENPEQNKAIAQKHSDLHKLSTEIYNHMVKADDGTNVFTSETILEAFKLVDEFAHLIMDELAPAPPAPRDEKPLREEKKPLEDRPSPVIFSTTSHPPKEDEKDTDKIRLRGLIEKAKKAGVDVDTGPVKTALSTVRDILSQAIVDADDVATAFNKAEKTINQAIKNKENKTEAKRSAAPDAPPPPLSASGPVKKLKDEFKKYVDIANKHKIDIQKEKKALEALFDQPHIEEITDIKDHVAAFKGKVDDGLRERGVPVISPASTTSDATPPPLPPRQPPKQPAPTKEGEESILGVRATRTTPESRLGIKATRGPAPSSRPPSPPAIEITTKARKRSASDPGTSSEPTTPRSGK